MSQRLQAGHRRLSGALHVRAQPQAHHDRRDLRRGPAHDPDRPGGAVRDRGRPDRLPQCPDKVHVVGVPLPI